MLKPDPAAPAQTEMGKQQTGDDRSMPYSILTDTSGNLPLKLVRERNIAIIPFVYRLDNEDHVCTDIESFDGEEFYRQMKAGKVVTTTQIPPQQYADFFAPYLKRGEDVIFVSMSSGISGSCNSARIAGQMLREEFPDRSVAVIDTKGAALGEGLVALRGAELRDRGLGFADTVDALERLSRRMCNVFTVDDLLFLRRGGRLSNFAAIVGTVLNVKPLLKGDEEGRITEEAFCAALSEKTRLVAMTQISNVLGVENDIKRFAAIAHERGAVFVCDGAQSVPHIPVDVQALDVDFLAFSGHKMCGPMGIGVLYGKKKWLKKMPPFLYGGEMIEYVTRESATYAELPHKFEAGTVNAAGAAGLAEAIRYYQRVGFDTIVEREEYLSEAAYRVLTENPHIHILGPKDAKSHHGIFTFTVDDVHPHDIAAILDSDGVNIRAGHHCAQPLMQFMKTPSTARASVSFYNTEEEIARLAESLSHIRERMGYGQ